MVAVCWFREDLRVGDNPALFNACDHEQVVAIYIISRQAWRQHDLGQCRQLFLLRQLQELSKELTKLNIVLRLLEVNSDDEIPALIYQMMQQINASHLYFNRQYEYDERRRDKTVYEVLTEQGITVTTYHDQVIYLPGKILNHAGQPYKVFTAFKKEWLQNFLRELPLDIFPIPKKRKPLSTLSATNFSDYLPDKIYGANHYWCVGESYAQQQLTRFVTTCIEQYSAQRDFPSVAGTSQLSPYLAAGMLSVRQCLQAALADDPFVAVDNEGIRTWVNEFIWREFYKHITYLFPHVCQHKTFNGLLDKPLWENNAEKFSAWCEGKTGYPLVDAAMRQLMETGWMHNRLRMVVAMFLTKDLWVDWRWGEKFFMQHLIDGDFSANNGGWQWSAGTGVDAAPYFRIFNPVTQSQRFDPSGEFIKKFCPELSALDVKSIHFPSNMQRQQCSYPQPMVDHKVMRALFLDRFNRLIR